MLTLSHRGNVGTTTYGTVDNLAMSYLGNQLINVEDTGANPSLSMSMDFKNGSIGEETEYFYNRNGNLVKDLNKGISKIEYNVLNLPQRILFTHTNNPVNEYVYTASGAKLSVIHKSSTEKRMDYVGNMIYENGSLKRILVDGGYIENGVYHFYLQDHLGNNRIVAKADGTVVQTNHYYPYGMSFAESMQTSNQPYKYNGRELDTEYGLNWYDYEARQMENAFGRFTSIDPMAEKYYSISPYVYVANNPINAFDLHGDSIWFTSRYNSDGYLIGITMHITGKVLNDSNQKIDMESAIDNITSVIIRTYKGNIDDIAFDTDVQLSNAQNMSEVSESDHLFVLTDKISELGDNKEISGASNYIGGKVAFINADYFSGIYDKTLGSRNYGSFTATHELGHLLGLSHENRNPFNIMRAGGAFYGIKSSQLGRIYNQWGDKKLNQSSNYILDPLGKKRPNVGNAHVYIKLW